MRPSLQDIAAYRIDTSLAFSDAEIQERHGWTDEHLMAVRSVVYGETAQQSVGLSAEDHYILYAIRSGAHLRQLDDVFGQASQTVKGHLAAVGAVRAKQQILNDMVERGQEMGFVPRRPEQKHVSVLFANLSEGELRQRLLSERVETRALVQAYGNRDILEIEAPAEAVATPAFATATALTAPTSKPALATLARGVIERRAVKVPAPARQGASRPAAP